MILGLFSPAFTHSAHRLIDGLVTDLLVLKLAGGRIGGFHQYKDALVLLVADWQQRFDTVRAEIAVDGQHIRTEGSLLLVAQSGGAQMRLGIRLHGRTDVVALAVHDDDHALALCIANGFGQRPHSLPAVQLIVGCLWLDSRNDVADSVDDGFVVL